jgi:hypothetical protein
MSAEAQKRTVVYGERPFGVGLLVVGYDVCNAFALESVQTVQQTNVSL